MSHTTVLLHTPTANFINVVYVARRLNIRS